MAVLPLALDHLPLTVHLRGAPPQPRPGHILPRAPVQLAGGEGLPLEREGEHTPRAQVSVAAD